MTACKILFITPPFTQLNTPYPASAYLTRFFGNQGIACAQADLSIETILAIFSKKGLEKVFAEAVQKQQKLTDNATLILENKDKYINSVDSVIRFLQNKDLTIAHRIAALHYLPQASRFGQLADLEWMFGNLGLTDRARYIATLYMADIGDFITETISPHFGFSKYAEKLGMSAVSFAPIEKELQKPKNLIDSILLELLDKYVQQHQPEMVAITVPFPGNLYAALTCAQHLKKNYPHIKTAMGGGYTNTELRSLSEPALFAYFDFVTLDDGEGPLMKLLEYLAGKRKIDFLQRTYLLENGKVSYINGCLDKDYPHTVTGYPDYKGLPLNSYLSVLDMPNPMHRLWSDGRWNKLTVAHGCYWKRCSFCDITLDYINRYEAAPAEILCDRIELLIAETGNSGFHFVDEAAPPLVLRDLAIELLKRGISISWWANIRFEKTFSKDLCRLLAQSGCIAVSGGLEVASDRLLTLMEKGVSIEQVSKVTSAFAENRIMVHAYLMYGFPTQTAQETIDSLEVVRQLFQHNLIQSAFWHRFAMTAHSPVGKNPEKYKVEMTGPVHKGFAFNDLWHEDPTGADHSMFTDGLNKALYNYMQGIGIDEPLSTWFDFKIKNTTHAPDMVERYLNTSEKNISELFPYRVLWTGKSPLVKGNKLIFEGNEHIKSSPKEIEWLTETIKKAAIEAAPVKVNDIAQSYEKIVGSSFAEFSESMLWYQLRKKGLLILWQ